MITLKQVTNGKTMRINRSPTNSREFTMEAFLEPGLVSYEDVGEGVSRLDKETIDKMLPSFIGCPLVIEHTDFSKDEVLNGKKDEKGNAVKVGSVTRAWWNAETGKYDCAFTVESDEAAKKINEGWSGSCAYGVRPPLGGGGELHAMRYDNTILDGVFEHLALVPNPRYEDCTIRMNGKPATIKENKITIPNTTEAISEKIALLVKEGKSQEEAAAIAYSMAGASKKNSDLSGMKVRLLEIKREAETIGLREGTIIKTPDGLQELKIKRLNFESGIAFIEDEKSGVAKDIAIPNIIEAIKSGQLKKNSYNKQAMFDKERADHPSFTDEQIWQIVEDHMTKENARVVLIDIPYRVISSIAEKKDISDSEVEQMLAGKGLRSVGTGGGMATFEFSGSEQQAAQAVRAVLGTLDSVDIGMIQNASSDKKAEVDAMLKRGASDETIMKRMKEKYGMSDEQTQKLLDSILFPNGKGMVTVKNADKTVTLKNK